MRGGRCAPRYVGFLGRNLGFGSFSKSHSWAGYICFVLLREYSSILVTRGDSCNRWYTMARHVPLTMHRTVATMGVALSFRAPAADPFAFASSSRTHSLLATFTGPARELCAAFACVCAHGRVWGVGGCRKSVRSDVHGRYTAGYRLTLWDYVSIRVLCTQNIYIYRISRDL